jgi:transcription antitermination factor NusG
LGVANVVRFGNDYIVVPDKVIQSLIGRANPLSGLHQLNTESLLTIGSRVRITVGALAGLEGIFERADANERVVVLLNILGNEARIKIHSGCVMPSRAA